MYAGMSKIGIVLLAMCMNSCEQHNQTMTVDVDPVFFRHNMVAQDEDGLYYYEYTLNGAKVFLEPDKNRALELNIDSGKYYPNLDSLVITAEPVSRAGKVPVYLIKKVILSNPD